jgi:hypothetical protein
LPLPLLVGFAVFVTFDGRATAAAFGGASLAATLVGADLELEALVASVSAAFVLRVVVTLEGTSLPFNHIVVPKRCRAACLLTPKCAR